MQLNQRQTDEQPGTKPQEPILEKDISNEKELHAAKVLSILKFCHYFPGCSPEWELFR